jgi:endonuclease/exonuclease/phosphatase family metal-dependent hydrolase
MKPIFILVAALGGCAARGGPRAVRVRNAAGAPTYDPAQPLRVLSWNVQYCAGTTQHFFYDGGLAVSAVAPRRASVRRTVEEVAAVIAAEAPDVVLLQEVDRASRRTGFVDQHARLLAALGGKYGCETSAWYWRVAYVPSPRQEHVGTVSMHLSVFSRFALASARRVPLPLLREPLYRRIFNLRRAVLDVRLATADGGPGLALLNTHLSAFSGADGTLAKQVGVLRALTAELDAPAAGGGQWVLAGDMNSLPPGVPADRHLEASEAALYGEAESPLAPLYADCIAVLPLGAMTDAQSAPAYFTYKPFHASSADRTIDHAFVGRAVEVANARVVALPEWLSDHLPLVLDLRCR